MPSRLNHTSPSSAGLNWFQPTWHPNVRLFPLFSPLIIPRNWLLCLSFALRYTNLDSLTRSTVLHPLYILEQRSYAIYYTTPVCLFSGGASVWLFFDPNHFPDHHKHLVLSVSNLGLVWVLMHSITRFVCYSLILCLSHHPSRLICASRP